MAPMIRPLAACALALAAALSFAQGRTITVSSPIANDFLGKSNTVKFSISGAQFEVLVRVKATFLADTSRTVTVEERFTPDANNKINDDIAVNFSEASPQGKWRLDITPIERNSSGQQFLYSPQIVQIHVNVDVKAPSFQNFNPQNSTFVKGLVRVSANLNELNVETWKVQINGSDIPNNSGNSRTVDVPWDTSTISKNGVQAISIKVDDLAKNSTSKNISVTLDRTAPNSQVLSPDPNTKVPPNTNIIVQVNITDQFDRSMDVTGVDVVARTLTGGFITRVARRAINQSGNTLSWSGRIRPGVKLPSEFKIVVTAVDKAGNKGTVQEVRVKVGNR